MPTGPSTDAKKAAVIQGVYNASGLFLVLFLLQGMRVGFASGQPYLFLVGAAIMLVLAVLSRTRLKI